MQIIMTMLATAMLVLFGFQNSDHVAVTLLMGPPTQIRLIFLLLITAAAGYLVSYIRAVSREIKLKREIRKLLAFRSEQLARLPANIQARR